ncbi:MAG: PQQ-binding-like beta-propeller repeat protein [Planctomycetaceae bacterium]|nr:PQQ-binding-like beta-propeller repeat protein [Planctomycetaceae bacterium]
MTSRFTLFAVMGSLSLSLTVQADWRQFRGTENSGLSAMDSTGDWSGETEIAWDSGLPGRGLACPIVVGDRVYVTASSGPRQETLHVLCFSTTDGKQLWERSFQATGRTVTHPKTSVAAPSPASDGERIFAFYSSNDLICLDLDGNLQWMRGLTYDFPNASNSLGMSSSPVVVGETVIVMVECDDQSFSAGLNVVTGETKWQIDRPRRANWTSPVIWPSDNQAQVLLQSSAGVTAVDAQTGQELWTYSEGASTIPSLVVSQNIAYVPSNGITALRPGESSSTEPEIVWQVGNLSPGTASPIVWGDKLYVISGAGVLTSASLEDGKRLWQARLKGPFSASPIIAGGKIVAVNEEGFVQVADPDKDGETVSSVELNETILGTPAVSDGAIYVRGDNHLWKILMK